MALCRVIGSKYKIDLQYPIEHYEPDFDQEFNDVFKHYNKCL